jgi:hypothetical protein
MLYRLVSTSIAPCLHVLYELEEKLHTCNLLASATMHASPSESRQSYAHSLHSVHVHLYVSDILAVTNDGPQTGASVTNASCDKSHLQCSYHNSTITVTDLSTCYHNNLKHYYMYFHSLGPGVNSPILILIP